MTLTAEQVAVRDDRAAWLTEHAFGRVLEYGYGTGKSARAIAASPRVESVTSVEPNEEYRPTVPPPKVTITDGVPSGARYDFVFVDCEAMNRYAIADYWRATGAVAVVDDALLFTRVPGIPRPGATLALGMEVA